VIITSARKRRSNNLSRIYFTQSLIPKLSFGKAISKGVKKHEIISILIMNTSHF